MTLSFTEKTDLNRAILKSLRLKMVDKEQSVIPFPGKLYNHIDPADHSIMGSIGQEPNPDFDGPQPPNAMGMVLLVSPNQNGKLSCLVSGQFDVSYRYIPNIKEMLKSLNRDVHGIKASQPVVTSYRRITIGFEGVPLEFDLPKGANHWALPPVTNPLQQAIKSVEDNLLGDQRAYKGCHLGATGGAVFYFDWDEGIQDQDALNEAVTRDIFDDLTDILRYQVQLRGRARKAPTSLKGGEGAYLMEVYLENCTSRDLGRAYGVNNPQLLDAHFELNLTQGQHHLLPHKLAPVDFRYLPGNGVAGYGITTSVEQVDETTFRTNALPVSELPRIENPEPEDLGMAEGPKFEILSINPINPINPINSLLKAVDSYCDGWEKTIATLRSSGQDKEANESAKGLADLRTERDAIADGIALLESDPDLLACFQWMNEAMLKAIQVQGKNFDSWRLFQLGFILTQIRAVYERCCNEDKLTKHLDTAEVLWFSTGGGKTEAYLGIIVMAMLYERKNDRHYGSTAWMRFPLRMLSVQQFQRLSYVVAQANMIRQREALGGHPFTMGYFTGAGAPGKITSSFDNDRDNFLPMISEERLNELKFIPDCPYCTESRSIEMMADLDNCRIKHVCTNEDCWSNIESDPGQYGEGIRGEIGIYVSDEECYRYLPTVMVGTIDKLAVISHNKRFRYHFGAGGYFCPQHGFTFEGRCSHSKIIKRDDGSFNTEQCPNNSRTSIVRTVLLPKMLYPGISFLLQDELHLLKENMGNFDAHYETLFCALQEANGGRKPKILAATATIKEYAHHVKHLYQREARRFPVPGHSLSESFYSRIVLDSSGNPEVRRLYAGILPLGTGRAMEKGAAHVSSRYLTLIDELRHELKTQPQSACDLLGFDVSKKDLLLHQIETYLNSNLIYVNSFQALSDVIQSLEDTQAEFPDRRYRQLSGKSTLEFIQETIEHIENKKPDDQDRQVIATSVVSHGVDMHRLNFMVITGWPKSIAEYMQSSARAGRIEPGIVLSVLNSKVIFQSNVFMDFKDYHSFMDRMVESVPVNRFAPNLLDRTLPGIISAWVNNWAPGQGEPWGLKVTSNAGKVKEALKNPSYHARQDLKENIFASLEVPEWLKSSFDERVVDDFMDALDKHTEIALRQLEGMSTDVAEGYLSDALERLLGNRPMRNMRDIESQIVVRAQTERAERVLDSLSR